MSERKSVKVEILQNFFNHKMAILLWVAWVVLQIVISLIAFFAPLEWKISFTFRDLGIDFGVHQFIGMRANFDGYHYITIARNGYGAFQHAFFPLFPLVLKVCGLLVSKNTLVAGLIINFILSLCVFVVWYKIFLLILTKKRTGGVWGMLYFLAFPTSFFLLTVYSESLFLLLLGLYTLFVCRRKYGLSTVFGLLLGLTRSAALFAPLIPLSILIFSRRKKPRLSHGEILSVVAPVLGTFIYMAYLIFTTGDPLAFVHAQEGFHNNRSTTIILLPQVYWRYFKILTLADINVTYLVAAVEVLLFTFALALLVANLLQQIRIMSRGCLNLQYSDGLHMGITLFSLSNLIYPTLTGTMSSVPRYALVGMGLFLVLAKTPLPIWIRIIILAGFSVLQGILFTLFAHGFFVS